jgi:hypothetical protein
VPCINTINLRIKLIVELLLTQLRVTVVTCEKMTNYTKSSRPRGSERPLLEVTTKQRLVKTEKTLCLL